jgi:hypothetical protein
VVSAPTVDPVLELVRSRLAGDGPAAAPGADGPAGVLAALLEQRQTQLEAAIAADGGPDDGADDTGGMDDVVAGLAVAEDLVARLTARVGELRAEVARTGERCDRFAAAVGACSACWGEDPGCRWCRGRGRPGALAPDPEEFTAWVVPAVRAHVRLRDHRVPQVGGGPVVVNQEENA